MKNSRARDSCPASHVFAYSASFTGAVASFAGSSTLNPSLAAASSNVAEADTNTNLSALKHVARSQCSAQLQRVRPA